MADFDIAESFGRMLATLETLPGDVQWPEVEKSGFLDMLAPESKGGAGLQLADAEPLFRQIGYRGVDLAIASEMLTRGLDGDQPGRALLACAAASLIAGAAERILELTIAHANQREQFGKPIGKQQAIQHQLAVLAEQVLIVRMASQMGCAQGLAPPLALAAIVKRAASAAVPVIASIAHAVHGAIGITREHVLHRYTTRLHALRVAHGSESAWGEALGKVHIEQELSGLDAVRRWSNPNAIETTALAS